MLQKDDARKGWGLGPPTHIVTVIIIGMILLRLILFAFRQNFMDMDLD